MKLFYFLVLVFVAVGLSEARDPKCLLPTDAGICYGHMPMYAYNNVAESCEPFVYGGCMGNENRFATLEDCQIACLRL